MAKTKTNQLLPSVFQTETNEKFLNATLDNLVTEPNLKAISGFVGRKFAPEFKGFASYVQEQTASRGDYQLESSVVVKNPDTNEIDLHRSYQEIIQDIRGSGGIVNDPNKVFSGQFVSYNPQINLDAFANYSEYLWIPNGPALIEVDTDVNIANIVGQTTANISLTTSSNAIPLTNGLKIKFTGNVSDSTYQNKEYYVDGVGDNIELVPVSELVIGKSQQKNTFDPTTAFTYVTTPSLNDQETSDILTIESFGLPDNQTVLSGFSNLSAQTYKFVYPYRGGLNFSADTESIVFESGVIGVSSVGIPFYGVSNEWTLTVSGGAVKTYDPIFTRVNFRDTYGGERGDNGAYFYRDVLPVIENAWGGTDKFSDGYTYDDGHSKIIGFAADGYPIYGPFGYSNASSSTSNVTRMTSSYRLDSNIEDRQESKTVTITLLDQNISTRMLVNSTTGLNPGMYLTAINGTSIDSEVRIINNSQSSVINAPVWDGDLNQLELSVNYSEILDPSTNEAIKNTDTLTFEFKQGSFIEDYVYEEGFGSLDEHNGRFCVTPEFPLGTYAYFTTIDANNNPVYPYIVGRSFYGATTIDTNQTLIDPIYVLINRASQDRNSWSRRNRWFHKQVADLGNQYSEFPIDLTQFQKAKRPIIEYNKNLQLLQNGRKFIGQVDLIDTVTTNALSTIQNQVPPEIDGIMLVDGTKIVFANDTDTNVRTKIWEVEIVNGLVNLNEIQTVEPLEIINVISGIIGVNQTFFLSTQFQWSIAQRYIGRTSFPIFDVVDENDISFADQTAYPSFNQQTRYNGTQIFNYKISTTSLEDLFLGFPISYRNINNLGDIEFVNYFDNDEFEYRVDGVNYKKKISTGYLVKNNGTERELVSIWTPSREQNHQYQIITYLYNDDPNFIVDCQEIPDDIHHHFKIYVNYEHLEENEYSKTITTETYRDINGEERERISSITVYVNRPLIKGDKVDFLIYSDTVSQLGYYEIPRNLEFNPLNEDFTSVTLGEMRDHIGHMVENNKLVDGVFPGSSNIRDFDITTVGGKIVKQISPLSYASLFLAKNQYNFIDAVNHARVQYTNFKNKILTLATTALSPIVNTVGGQREALDLILQEIVLTKNNYAPWFASDMIPFGDDYNRIDYTVIDIEQRKYPITTIFNDTELSNKSVLVYINRTIAVKGKDYTFDQDIPVITFADDLEFSENDTITIFEYNNTDGCYCPETPTKLGLFPKYEPSIVTIDSRQFIQGHDGSLTLAFGDFRDDILFEFESRIYNNIKVTEKKHLTDFYWAKPGKFRTTNFNLREFNSILSQGFYSWLKENNIEDFTTNDIYKEYVTDASGELPRTLDINTGVYSDIPTYTKDPNRFFSYNYKNTKDLDGELLPGSWRACFDYYYDTYTPNLTPWEMLGFSNKPTWWESEYGPAPYTSGNLRLWEDLEEGRIRQGSRTGVDVNFARSGLTNIIPVDEVGNLIAPANLFAGERVSVDASWTFGNWGPIEWAWRRSPEYRYSLQIALSLTQPAKYFSFGVNTQDYDYNELIDQYVITDTNKQITKSDVKINGRMVDSNIIRGSGVLNWIAEKLFSDGIVDKNVLKSYIDNHDVRLSYRLAGFSDKKYLKMIAEQYSPQSQTQGVLIPDEDYDLTVSESAPLNNAVYSGVIVQRVADGYKVSGYDTVSPYFLVVNPDFKGKSYPIKIVNEQVKFYEDHLQNVNVVYYNTVFRTRQQVANFISAYQKYLNLTGFEFDDYDGNLETIKNWELSLKEFLYWSQQGWPVGSVITLSPVGASLKFSSPSGVVGELDNTIDGYRIQNQNNKIVPKNNYTVNRQGNNFRITTTNPLENNISFARFKLVQHEHVVIFNNQTQFKDVIYNPIFGQRQFRIKVVGKKTANWTGSMSPEGFILNQDNIAEWESNTDYKRGTLINFKNFYYVAKDNIIGGEEFKFSEWKLVDSERFKFGLLPNFSTISGQSRYYFDVDKVDLDSEFDQMSLGLIGYRSRSYFVNAGLNDVSQVKLYQGIVKQKGTKNSIDAVSKIFNDTTIHEEWAFRVGEYGALENNNFVDIQLSESDVKGNPVSITINNGRIVYTGNRVDPNGIVNYSSSKVPTNIFAEETVKYNQENRLKTAGFVNFNDVDYTLFSFDQVNASQLPINTLKTGDTVWVASDFYTEWNVYRVVNSKNNIIKVSNLFNSTLLIETKKAHELSEDFVVILKTKDDVEGMYRITTVVNKTQFIVSYTGTNDIADFVSNDYENVILTYMQSVKIDYSSDIVDITPIDEWDIDDSVWVKNTNTNNWKVLTKKTPWDSLSKVEEQSIQSNNFYGTIFDVSDDKSSLVYTNFVQYPRTLTHYRLIGSQYRFFENINIPLFSDIVKQIDKIVFKTNFLFVLSTMDSNEKSILIFNKNSSGRITFYDILNIKNNDILSVTDDEKWLFVDERDFEETVRGYEYESITELRQNITLNYGQLTYQLNSDTNLNFVTVYSDPRETIIYPSFLYELFENTNGDKFIRFFQDPLSSSMYVRYTSESIIPSDNFNTTSIDNTLITWRGEGYTLGDGEYDTTILTNVTFDTINSDIILNLTKEDGVYIFDQDCRIINNNGNIIINATANNIQITTSIDPTRIQKSLNVDAKDYTVSNFTTSVSRIDVISSTFEYEIDNQFNFDFVKVQGDGLFLTKNKDYSLREENSRKYITFFSFYNKTQFQIIQQPKFNPIKQATISPSGFTIRNIDSDSVGKTIIVSYFGKNEVDVIKRNIEKYVVTSNTLNTVFDIDASMKIYSGDILLQFGIDYTLTSPKTISFINQRVSPGNIITIETNHLQLVETIQTEFFNSNFDFGESIKISKDGTFLYVSSPKYTENEFYEIGIVERWGNYSLLSSTYVSGEFNFVDDSIVLYINDFVVPISFESIDEVINKINTLNIPGVVASRENDTLKLLKNLNVDNVPLNVYSSLSLVFNQFFTYTKLSNIKNPTKVPYDYFGKSINLSNDNNLILIGSPDGTAIQDTTFDLLSQIIDIENETTFDGDTTRFKDKSRCGCIWTFNNLYDSLSDLNSISETGYIYQLAPENIDRGRIEEVRFSETVSYKNDTLLVGAPRTSIVDIGGDNHGQIYLTKQISDGWTTIRESTPLIDLRSIEKLFVYSKQTNQILYGLDYIDPNKGKILGIAEQDITYKTDYDPATYNTGDDIGSYVWNEKQIGQVWWDLSTVRFVEYEQDSIEYRTTNWAKLFENSSVDVYEWVESLYPPNLYEDNGGEGTPKDGNNTTFTTTEYVDDQTGIVFVKYYFWVKGKTTVPNNVRNRRIPISTIEEYIRNPVNSGIKFLAPLSKNSIALYNVYGDLVGTDRVLHIDYKSSVNDEIIFGEFSLISETDNIVDKIPSTIVNKLADSLGGLDSANNIVPDPSLPVQKQLGLNVRPRQTVFVNNRNATKTMVDYCNEVFKKYKISNRYDVNTILFGESIPSEGLVLSDDLLFNEQVDSYQNLLYINRITTPIGYRVLVVSDETIEGIWSIYELNSSKEWEKVRAQSWSTQEYWMNEDWYASGYDSTVTPEFTFADYNDFNRRAIYTISGFTIVNGGDNYDANTTITLSGGGAITQALARPVIQNGKITDITLLTVGSGYISQPRVTINSSEGTGAIINSTITTESGRIFKILNDGTGKWNLIKTTTTGYDIIGIENGTIQLSDNLWDYDNNKLGFDNDVFDDSRFDKNPQKEIREIFLSLRNIIFANELSSDFVGLFFALIKYVFSEQSYVDWAFKSSYIRVNHGVGDLSQTKLYSPKTSDLLRQYIDEVKPYHTIVREYTDRHDYIESFDSSSTDFDIQPYFDTITNLFRSPQYQEEGRFLQTYPQDQSTFDDIIYDSWQENFKYYVSDAIIIDGGTGFDINTVFTRTVTNNYGGTDATIQFTTDSTGKIILAKVLDGGSGFIRSFNGDNQNPTRLLTMENGASVVLRFANDFIRKVKTTIKYDRVSYGKEPREWLPNKRYKQFEIIRYVDKDYARNLSLNISGNIAQSEVFDGLAFDASPFEYYAFDLSEQDAFVPGRAWIALKDFDSGDTFRPTTFFNIDGQFIERQVLQPYTNYVSIRVWEPNTEYYQDQIVVYRSTPYLVISRFRSGAVFSGNNLDRNLGKFVLETPVNDNAANRILVYYNPVTGRPSRDLSSLMVGIDYPGVIIQGFSFEVNGAFDVASFDLYPFDLVVTDTNGNQLFAEEEIDSIVDGMDFIDVTENAESIIDGDGYVTPEYSHAPEELLPGRVYDTMDMKVLTLYADPLDTTYISWINSDAYTLSGFFGNGGSNIASANLTLVGYTVSGNVWLESNIGNTIQTNTVVINNLPIVGNTIDISNISIPVANSTQWISVTNISVDTTAVANTTIESPKLWANLTQSEFTDKFNYHIWKDMNDFNQYLATNIATTTTLVSNLNATSTCLKICGNFEVANASVLPEPVIVIAKDDIAAEALNRRLDPNSTNIIDLTNYNFGNLANAVYEVYGNVQVYQSKDQYIFDETVYNSLDGIYKKPGVIMINGERIEYWSKFNDTNMIVGARRATRGTSLLTHTAGEKVYDYTRIVPGVGFLQGDYSWIPEENTTIPTQIEDTFLNFDDLIMEDGSPIVTETDVPIATDGTIITGIGSYVFEEGEKYIQTKIFNLPTPGPQLATESGDIIILDGISPETAIEYEPPSFTTDGRGLYNSGISSPNTTPAVFVVNSLYED